MITNKVVVFRTYFTHASFSASVMVGTSSFALYQREIAKIIHLVPEELKIEGLIRANDIGFIDFKKGINFDAFLLSAK